jgi:cytochrome c-type biogenesis protein CcmE
MKNKKLIIGGIVILVAVVVLGYAGFMGAATYYYEVGEYQAKLADAATPGQTVRISGIVASDFAREGNLLRFSLLDNGGGTASLKVEYKGTVPETFQAGRQVVVEGTFAPGRGVFVASNVIAKCSSKYQAE